MARHFRVGSIDDRLDLAADLGGAPGAGDFLLRPHDLVAPRQLDLLGKMVRQAIRGRARFARIWEDAASLELLLADKGVQLLELLLRLAGEADDECRAQV